MTKKVVLFALSVFLYQLCFVPVLAIKAYPFPLLITQPDGSQLTIQLRGDENNHFQLTEDGYLLKKNATGYFTYAILSTDGVCTASTTIARNINKRSRVETEFLKTVPTTAMLQKTLILRQKSKMLSAPAQPRKAYPLNGAPKALVILANFKDKAFMVPSPQLSFQNLLTQDGYSANGGTGSARDYFKASSYAKFAPNFVVVGPVTLPQSLDYYGKNDANGNDVNPGQMIVDACNAADVAGLDFTQYDTDGDGFIDNVFVYYAGYNEAEGAAANTIWPHRWAISDAGISTGITFDGKKIQDYSCTSELKGAAGANMCGIGTFCHEFGHVIGLPDFYHTNDASGSKSTLDYWEIMDAGAYNNGGCTPPTYSTYERFYLGYSTPEQISTASDLTLVPIYQDATTPSNTTNQSFLFSATTHNLTATSPNPKEFFMIEYRKKTGWDSYLPGEGMCIWHVDYDQTAWDNNGPNNYTGTTQTASSHMRLYLQPLSGSTATPGAAFSTGSFTPTTWLGANINRAITAITKSPENITFKFMGGAIGPNIAVAGALVPFATTVGVISEIQTVLLSGNALAANVGVDLLDKTNFDIKLSTGSIWVKNLSIPTIAGSINETLQIRYHPGSAGSQADELNFSSAGAASISLKLSGTAELPYNPNAPTIQVGKIENLIQFASTKLQVTRTKSFSIRTANILNPLVLSISGANAAMFTVSPNSLPVQAVNGSAGASVTITYSPTSIGLHAALLTVDNGSLNPLKQIVLQGEGN